MIGTLILGAAMYCGQAQQPQREWLAVRTPEGATARVWGWREGGNVRWFPEEQPRAVPSTTSPAPAPAPPALNFGVSAERLGHSDRVIRASDPETLREVRESVGDAVDDCDPIERRKPFLPDLDFGFVNWPAYAFAGLLAVLAFALLRRRES